MEGTLRYFKNSYSNEGLVEISQDLFKSRTLTCVNQILNNFTATPNNCDGGMF